MTLAIGCRRGCLLLLLLLSGVVYCKCSSWHCCLPDFHVVDALSGRRLATRTEKPVHSLATYIRSLIKTSPSIVRPSCYLTNCVTLTCSNKLDSVACKHAADRHTFLLSRFAMRLWRRVWNTNIMFELIGDWTRQHTTGQDKWPKKPTNQPTTSHSASWTTNNCQWEQQLRKKQNKKEFVFVCLYS